MKNITLLLNQVICYGLSKCLKVSFIGFLCIIYSLSAFSQLIVADNETKAIIPFVHFIGDEGSLLTTSNIKGVVEWGDTISTKKLNVSVAHISYGSIDVDFNKLLKLDTLFLKERFVNLPEIVIKEKEGRKYYVKLHGYYRSYQIENGIPKYYCDGIVDYYIPSKGRKKLSYELTDNRSFRNVKLLESEKKKKFTVGMEVAGVPYIECESVIANLHFSYRIDSSYIIKDDSVVGIIDIVPNIKKCKISIDKVAPRGGKEKSLFNYISIIKKNEVVENYSADDIDKLSKNNMVNRKEYRKIFFKHKQEKSFNEIDVFHEFYVVDVSFINKREYKKANTTKHFGLKQSTFYSTDYWEKSFFKVPTNIKKCMGEELIAY